MQKKKRYIRESISKFMKRQDVWIEKLVVSTWQYWYQLFLAQDHENLSPGSRKTRILKRQNPRWL